jgi:two-component system chemotaxis response regulator CheB
MSADRIRVLIIDDSLTIRAMVEHLISEDCECEVTGVAGDVDAARAMMSRASPDVITLDLAMPGMDGLHFLDELMTHHHSPVIVVSSSTAHGSEAAAQALARGADACFDKSKIIMEAPRFLKVLKRAARKKAKRGASVRQTRNPETAQ